MAEKVKENKVRDELGKWFLDVAKYILTAVIISTMFSEVEDKWWIIGVAATLVLVCITVGILFLRYNTKKKTNKKR